MFKLSAFNLLKALSPLAIAASMLVVTEAPTEAVPHIYVPSSRYHSGYSRSRIVAPPSLNVTPPPGRHIPLPRSSRHYYRPSRARYRSRYDDYDRRYERRYRDRYYDDSYRDGRVYRRKIMITPVLKY
ncbi:MAG: hypothetical protein AB4206_12825 [Xenococcaceae cyanobacterium]